MLSAHVCIPVPGRRNMSARCVPGGNFRARENRPETRDTLYHTHDMWILVIASRSTSGVMFYMCMRVANARGLKLMRRRSPSNIFTAFDVGYRAAPSIRSAPRGVERTLHTRLEPRAAVASRTCTLRFGPPLWSRSGVRVARRVARSCLVRDPPPRSAITRKDSPKLHDQRHRPVSFAVVRATIEGAARIPSC